MKHLLTIVITILILSCTNGDDRESTDAKVIGNFSQYSGIDTTAILNIDRYEVDLDFDSRLDTIILENLKDLVGDPQLFTIIRIKLASNKEFVIKNIGGYKQDPNTKMVFKIELNLKNIYSRI